jgi:hypothetical protein
MRGFPAPWLLLPLAGCGDKAKDLHDTAQLEEKENNQPHAMKLTARSEKKIPARLTPNRRSLVWPSRRNRARSQNLVSVLSIRRLAGNTLVSLEAAKN